MELVSCSNLLFCRNCSHMNFCSNSGSRLLHIKGTALVHRISGKRGAGKSASLRLYSGTVIDQNTGKGRLSDKVKLKHGKKDKWNGTKVYTYNISFYVDPGFGKPGALLVRNTHKHEFLLNCVTIEAFAGLIIHFECNSWVYPFSKTKTDRVFFSNTSYLPSQTPKPLQQLRSEELISLRGKGTGERKEWDRIYDYAYYNDLGNPDKGEQHVRTVLGGSKNHPYPRRGRTGRPPSQKDPLTESRPRGILNLDIFVPPDERFSPEKLSEFISNAIEAILHFLIPEAKSLFQQDPGSFESIGEIREMFSSNRKQVLQGWIFEKLKNFVPEELVKELNLVSKKSSVEFPLPQIIAGNEYAWKDDKEFGREMLAGINPAFVKTLEKFPIQNSSIKASHIEHNLDGLTLNVAMLQWRIFILDHHDYLYPFLNQINRDGVCCYASRTLLFLCQDASLKPLVIELCLPGSKGEEIQRIFLPATEGTDAALWQLAKTHVAANDSGYHQLISHWLKTHAVVEPFVIATRRQLSEMHPIHRLLHPHFKDTMHVNALARSILINSGGVLEKTMFPGKFSMELSSEIYKTWRFDEQGLPADLIKRNLAFEDSFDPSGARLLFEDYPYGADGIEIWTAIKTWVNDFCSNFYKNDEDVATDTEIQSWWSEIRNVGHGDKREETWWYKMDKLDELNEALTTLIWISSALHASVNYGQYGYAGYPPNRPTKCRKFIPKEGTDEFAEFLIDPDKYFLEMLPQRFDMTLGVALIEVLSKHTSDEVYLGQRPSPEWTDDDDVRRSFEKFRDNLKLVETRIKARNGDGKFKNRWGPAKIPYRLLYPDTSTVTNKGGLTGRGIPNSVSM